MFGKPEYDGPKCLYKFLRNNRKKIEVDNILKINN